MRKTELTPVPVRDFEPRLALDGGPGGIDVFQRLIEQARDRLKAGGHLLVETGSDQEKPPANDSQPPATPSPRRSATARIAPV